MSLWRLAQISSSLSEVAPQKKCEKTFSCFRLKLHKEQGSPKNKQHIIKSIRLLAVLSVFLAFSSTGFATNISILREKAAEEDTGDLQCSWEGGDAEHH